MEKLVNIWGEDNVINVRELKIKARPEYVAWIDLMGAKEWMAGSIRRAAEIIGIVHIAGIRAAKQHEIKAYPVIDGVYLVGTEKGNFKAATRSAMRSLAATFLSSDSEKRFLVRGGIAYGRVLHGEDIEKLHDDLKAEYLYANCLAIGISIGQAFNAEKQSPPFGYYVDMTARSTASVNVSPYISAYYRWWPTKQKEEADKAAIFGEHLDKHFDYLADKHFELGYKEDRLKEHRSFARQYFRYKPKEQEKEKE